MSKYGVTHRLATAYHPQTSGQVEVLNHSLKRILERTVGENRASWFEKIKDALWAFKTAYKTPIGCTPYKLVYGKSCHLPIELEHKAYWALKHVNFNLKIVGDHRKLQINELNELHDQAYENSLIYKEKTKKLHDSKINNRIFNVGPFTITQVFPYGTIELSQLEGLNFKEHQTPVDATLYRGMIGSLMYLTSSRPDLIYAVCLYARYQAKPTEKHLQALKRIFRYLKGTINMIPLYCDNKSAIALCCNNIQHSRTKHIDVRYHFIKEQVENEVVELYFVQTKYQLADIFTIPFPRERFNFLIEKLGMRSMSSKMLKRLAEKTKE
nr:reverse transcriptase domain-containing protein [Tanacetum cinerariifolium]